MPRYATAPITVHPAVVPLVSCGLDRADDAVVKCLGEEGVEEAAAGNQLQRLCGLIAVQVLGEDGR